MGGERSGQRLGRARVVRDGIAHSERLARPVDRRARAPRPAHRRGRRRRRCGDSCGRRVLPPRRMADHRLCCQGEDEQPGRVPGTPAGPDAAPLVPGEETGGQRAALRIRPRLRSAHRQRPQDLRSRAGAGVHQLREDGALHHRRRDRRRTTGRERHRRRARVGPVRRRGTHVGLGLGGGGVARDSAAAARSTHHVYRWLGGDRRVGWIVEGQHRGSDALRQLLPRRDLRREALDAGMGPARLQRLGLAVGARRHRRRPGWFEPRRTSRFVSSAPARQARARRPCQASSCTTSGRT